MKKKIFAATFLAVCSAGLFIGLAGGAEWGTTPCGLVAFVTLSVATFVSFAAADIFGREEKK
ncbi:hypothetical protein D3C79_877930 [compost metagenome]